MAFKPIKMVLKHEDEDDEGRAVGPVFLEDADGNTQTVSDEWLDFDEAYQLAAGLNLPLEVF